MTTWDNTPEGANLSTAYSNLQTLFNTRLPNHKQSLDNLAVRPIKG